MSLLFPGDGIIAGVLAGRLDIGEGGGVEVEMCSEAGGENQHLIAESPISRDS